MENALSYLSDLTDYLPAELDFIEAIKFTFIFACISLLMGFIGRFIFGKRSSLNHAVSAAMGILFIYVVTVIIYTFNPVDLSRFLSPLPFVSFSGEYMILFPFAKAEVSAICCQIVSMIMLAFLVNLLDTFIPKGKKIISWYLYRFLTVLLSMAAHFLVTWLATAFLPDVLVRYATIILLGILLTLILLGLLKGVLGLVLTALNPIVGALYTFFFSHLIGKQLTKAVFSTVLLCVVFFLLDKLGYTVICIASGALVAYIPLIIVLLVLWYLLGHVL